MSIWFSLNIFFFNFMTYIYIYSIKKSKRMHYFLLDMANQFHVKKTIFTAFNVALLRCVESKMALRCLERRRNVTSFTSFRFVIKSVLNNSFEYVMNTMYALSSIQNSLILRVNFRQKCSNEILLFFFSFHYAFCFHLIESENKVFWVLIRESAMCPLTGIFPYSACLIC